MPKAAIRWGNISSWISRKNSVKPDNASKSINASDPFSSCRLIRSLFDLSCVRLSIYIVKHVCRLGAREGIDNHKLLYVGTTDKRNEHNPGSLILAFT